jgi:hypothetical protein
MNLEINMLRLKLKQAETLLNETARVLLQSEFALDTIISAANAFAFDVGMKETK